LVLPAQLKPKKIQAILFLMDANGVVDVKMFVVNLDIHVEEVVAIKLIRTEVGNKELDNIYDYLLNTYSLY
jgi:hypothetical protein